MHPAIDLIPGPLATMTDGAGLVSGLLSAATTIARKKFAAFTDGARSFLVLGSGCSSDQSLYRQTDGEHMWTT